eukprot:6209824-Pleurochrysis_carterae.AAC.4
MLVDLMLLASLRRPPGQAAHARDYSMSLIAKSQSRLRRCSLQQKIQKMRPYSHIDYCISCEGRHRI